MKLTNQEVLKALKISKAIQNYIDKTGDTNLRSTDVFPMLVKKGLFVQDPNNGVYFRRFLKKLSRTGELKSLIPQCSNISPQGDETFNQWYFHCAKDVMSARNQKKSNKPYSKQLEKLDVIGAIEIVKKLIEGNDPITNEELPPHSIVKDPKIKAALELIITPESYEVEIEKLKVEISEETTSKNNSSHWIDEMKEKVLQLHDGRKKKNFNQNQLKVRERYSRAFDYYTDQEVGLMKQAWSKCSDEQVLAEIFKRTPTSILMKLGVEECK